MEYFNRIKTLPSISTRKLQQTLFKKSKEQKLVSLNNRKYQSKELSITPPFYYRYKQCLKQKCRCPYHQKKQIKINMKSKQQKMLVESQRNYRMMMQKIKSEGNQKKMKEQMTTQENSFGQTPNYTLEPLSEYQKRQKIGDLKKQQRQKFNKKQREQVIQSRFDRFPELDCFNNDFQQFITIQDQYILKDFKAKDRQLFRKKNTSQGIALKQQIDVNLKHKYSYTQNSQDEKNKLPTLGRLNVDQKRRFNRKIKTQLQQQIKFQQKKETEEQDNNELKNLKVNKHKHNISNLSNFSTQSKKVQLKLSQAQQIKITKEELCESFMRSQEVNEQDLEKAVQLRLGQFKSLCDMIMSEVIQKIQKGKIRRTTLDTIIEKHLKKLQNKLNNNKQKDQEYQGKKQIVDKMANTFNQHKNSENSLKLISTLSKSTIRSFRTVRKQINNSSFLSHHFQDKEIDTISMRSDCNSRISDKNSQARSLIEIGCNKQEIIVGSVLSLPNNSSQKFITIKVQVNSLKQFKQNMKTINIGERKRQRKGTFGKRNKLIQEINKIEDPIEQMEQQINIERRVKKINNTYNNKRYSIRKEQQEKRNSMVVIAQKMKARLEKSRDLIRKVQKYLENQNLQHMIITKNQPIITTKRKIRALKEMFEDDEFQTLMMKYLSIYTEHCDIFIKSQFSHRNSQQPQQEENYIRDQNLQFLKEDKQLKFIHIESGKNSIFSSSSSIQEDLSINLHQFISQNPTSNEANDISLKERRNIKDKQNNLGQKDLQNMIFNKKYEKYRAIRIKRQTQLLLQLQNASIQKDKKKESFKKQKQIKRLFAYALKNYPSTIKYILNDKN